jgi:2-deoxy-scyllo-inosamine dehydrogenase (SAM-dependent)
MKSGPLSVSSVAYKVARHVPHRWKDFLRPAYLYLYNLVVYRDAHYFWDITIETSVACNRGCHYCPVSILPQKQRLIDDPMVDLFASRLRDARWRGTVNFHFYNEPLLNLKLENIVKRVAESCPKCIPQIHTNGDRLTEARFQSLVDSGVLRFGVSRHVPYSKEWDQRMFALRDKHPDHITILENDLRSWLNRGGLMKTLPGQNSMAGATSCTTPQYVTVTVDGKALLCCCDYNREYPVGDITKQSLNEIWYSPDFARLRKELRGGTFTTPMCRKCVELDK